MIGLILYILICLSITNLLVCEYVFEWLRKLIDKYFKYSLLNKLIRCQTCMGFWIGCMITYSMPNLLPQISDVFIINIIVGGLISSITNKMIAYKF